MKVLIHPLAEPELAQLPGAEKAAMDHAMEKHEALGARLLFPHQSGVAALADFENFGRGQGEARGEPSIAR